MTLDDKETKKLAAAGPSTLEEKLAKCLNDHITQHNNLSSNIAALSPATAEIAKHKVDKDGPHKHLEELKKRLDKHVKEHETEVKSIKSQIAKEVKGNLESQTAEFIKIQVEQAIKEQVAEEVKKQVPEYIPVSIQKQRDDYMVCWGLVENAKRNAQARLQNSTIQIEDIWAPLAVVRKEDGEPGSLYPADLEMYWGYDVGKVRSLLKEYGLDYQEGESKEALYKRFLRYIGVKVDFDFEMIQV